MKYLYGDSIEFKMQIDFLRLLNNFVDTSVKLQYIFLVSYTLKNLKTVD